MIDSDPMWLIRHATMYYHFHKYFLGNPKLFENLPPPNKNFRFTSSIHTIAEIVATHKKTSGIQTLINIMNVLTI